MHLRLVPTPDPGPDEIEYRLTPRQAIIVAAIASIMADDVYDDIDELGDTPITPFMRPGPAVLDLYPPITWTQNSQWRRHAARAFDDLAADIDAGHSPTPTCTAEEMALHLILDRSRDMHTDGELDHLITRTNAQPDDHNWDAPREYLFEDDDVLTLSGPTPAPLTEFLTPTEWFTPFDSNNPRDPNRADSDG